MRATTERTVFASDWRAKAAVQLLRRLTTDELLQVVRLMPELQSLAAKPSVDKSTEDYWRRALREERGGYQPSLDDVFLEGVTYREYFALSEAEQDAFWDKLFSNETWRIGDFEEVNVNPNISVAAR